MARQRLKRRRPMSDINVVPYIDVMLVLLIIFMVTAPLITQGVHVDLPEADAEPLSQDEEPPLVISVNRAGELFVNIGEGREDPVDDDTLIRRIQVTREHNPKIQVMVRGDADVEYARVVHAMVLAQAAGVPSVGLITEPPESR
jgi:biopolymer transport protein TolR